MAGVPEQLVLPTFSVRLLDSLVVFVSKPGTDIADADWQIYVQWLKQVHEAIPNLKILATPGGGAPSSAQRSLLNRELNTERIRLAVLLSDPKLVAVVRVMSWFMKSGQAFRASELEKALSYLGETNPARVRTTIRNLGGVVYKEAL